MTQLTLGTAMMAHPTFEDGEVLPDTIEPRLEEAAALITDAAQRGCDILCLPEYFADPRQGGLYETIAEPIGGPICTWLSEQARAYGMALVTSLAIRDERGITNAGVAYSKQGELVGRYDKVHLPPGEREHAGPGDAFNVFELEGAKVGMQTCYDLDFPEGCRILGLKGAEIIFWPNMWGGMPEDNTDILMKARAIDSHCFFVSSAFMLTGSSGFTVRKLHGRSCIIDPVGKVLAEVGLRLGVAVAAIDLDDVRNKTDDTRKRYFDHRLPHLYGDLTAT